MSFCPPNNGRDLHGATAEPGPRSRSNYKYRRRNKSGGDAAAAGSDTEHDSEYWTRRRRTILQSLESAALLGAGSSVSGSGSSCSSGRDPVVAGCSCRHVHCPRCRHSPAPDCGHSGTAHTWHRVASPVFLLCTSSDPSAVMRMQFALDKASRAVPVFEPCASVQG